MKIAILYDQWEGTEEYPGAAHDEEHAGHGGSGRPKLDREEVFEALVSLGHDPSYHCLDGHASTLCGLARTQEDLIFNLVESYAGDDGMDMQVAAFLELLGKRFTGSDSRSLHLAQHKAIAKKIMRFHDLLTPTFAVSYRGMVEHSHDIAFPLIVKPVAEDGSIGIDAGSVVHGVKDLMERIAWIHEEFDSPALIEEYIDGREIYAAILGNGRPEALPLVELDLSKLPEGMPHVAGFDVKYERSSPAYRKTKSRIADDLEDEISETMQRTAISAFQALGLRDYARVDMRLTSDGRVYVLEANPNPWLSSSAEFAMAAKKSGRSFTTLIGEIVEMAMAR